MPHRPNLAATECELLKHLKHETPMHTSLCYISVLTSPMISLMCWCWCRACRDLRSNVRSGSRARILIFSLLRRPVSFRVSLTSARSLQLGPRFGQSKPSRPQKVLMPDDVEGSRGRTLIYEIPCCLLAADTIHLRCTENSPQKTQLDQRTNWRYAA